MSGDTGPDTSLPDTVLQPSTPAASAPAGAAIFEQPAQIGLYRILEKIGEGGFGIVYRAEQTAPLKREVALKIIRPGMASAEIIARFEAERQTLALMEHPHIARVYDAGTTAEGLPYFVMEFVAGAPVTTWCDEHRLTIPERLVLFAEVCDAVQHAHQKAVLHRDLKPSNILVAEVDGRAVPKVIDFGIAKAMEAAPEEVLQASLARTRAGMVVGTPQYMSPEQAGATPDVDTRSDVYMLGVILHELLTGQTPLSREELKNAALDEVLRRIREVETRRPSSRLTPATEAVHQSAITRQTEPSRLGHTLRGELDWIMLRALEKERERRYQSASLLAEDVRRFLRHEPVSAGPPQFRYRALKFLRRNRGPVAAAAVIALTLIGATAFSMRQAHHAEIARQGAEASKQDALNESGRRQQLLKEASNLSQQAALSRLRDATIGDGRIPEALAYLSRALAFDPANRAAQATAVMTLTGSGTAVGPRVPIMASHSTVPLCLSEDGTKLFTAEEKTPAAKPGQTRISIFETELRNGFPRRELLAFDHEVSRLVAHPHGRLLAIQSLSRVDIWDMQDVKRVGTASGHKGYIFKLEFSKDGRWMGTASSDHTARIWDARTGRPMSPPLEHGNQATELMFSSDNRRLMTASCLADTCQLLEVPSGKPIGTSIKLKGPIDAAAISPDGLTVMTAERWGNIYSWSTQSQQQSRPVLRGGWGVGALKFSRNGRWLLSTYRGPDAHLWNLTNPDVLPARLAHSGELRDADFSPDDRMVATASQDKTAGVWHIDSAKPVCEPLAHPVAVREIKFSATGRWLVTRGEDGSVRIWASPVSTSRARQLPRTFDTDLMKVLAEAQPGESLPDSLREKAAGLLATDATSGLPMSQWVRDGSVVIGPEMKTIVVRKLTKGSSERSDGRIWRTRDWTMLGIAGCGEKITSSTYLFSPDGSRIFVEGYLRGIGNDPVKVFDAITGQMVPPGLEERQSLHRIGISPDGTKLMTLNTIIGLQLWQVDGMRPLLPRRIDIERGMINSAVFFADGRRLVTASTDGRCCVYDAITGQRIGDVMCHDDDVNMAALSPDESLVVTASDDLTARIWDAKTHASVAQPMVHRSAVTDAEFAPDGCWVLTATTIGYGMEGSCFLWETSSGRLVTELPPGATCRFGSNAGWLGMMRDAECRVTELPTLVESAPGELSTLLELQAGMKIDAQSGRIRLSEAEAIEKITALRLAISRSNAGQDTAITRLIRWWLDDPRTRKVTPNDKVSVPDMIDDLVSHSLQASNKRIAHDLAEEACKTDSLHPLVHLALASASKEQAPIRALRSHGVERRLPDPDNETVYGKPRWARYARLAFDMLLADTTRTDEQSLSLADKCLVLAKRLEPAHQDMAAMDKRLTDARAGVSRASPRKFSYEYKSGDDAGPRVWTREGDEWTERSPAGKERKFHAVGVETVSGISGVVVKAPSVEFRVFIPNLESRAMNVLARDGEGSWYSLGPMLDIKAE